MRKVPTLNEVWDEFCSSVPESLQKQLKDNLDFKRQVQKVLYYGVQTGMAICILNEEPFDQTINKCMDLQDQIINSKWDKDV